MSGCPTVEGVKAVISNSYGTAVEHVLVREMWQELKTAYSNRTAKRMINSLTREDIEARIARWRIEHEA